MVQLGMCSLMWVTTLLLSQQLVHAPFCTDDVDECQHQPNVCHNGGTCFNIQGGYSCVCVNGWTGESCQENIDDCATAVCFNGATCHDRVASFFCECPMGKTGLLCHLEDACVSNPCHGNATCETNPVSGRVICTCPPGFTGGACDKDVDECSIGANPCEHFGRCVNTHGSFQCQCGRGYTGPRCEADLNEYLSPLSNPLPTASHTPFCTDDVDECQHQPNVCHNGGTCHNSQGGYSCVCVNGWTGENCQENIDDCANAVCFNGATCLDRVASFVCVCPMGKTGLLCHLEDACVSNPCHRNATCETNPVSGRVICTCPPGFTGGGCDKDVDECSIGANPCEHFGRCVNTHGSFQCQCGRGYTGPRCETDLNEYLPPLSNPLPTASHRHGHSFTDACANNPCENGARCSNWNGRYKCICLPGFKGRNCRVDIDECRTPGLCQNGGQCQNTPGSFRCRCPSGYTGQFCEAIYVPCAPSQCLNGGTCRQTGELTYQCACLPGFKGVNCEINIDDCLGHKCMNGGTCVDGVNTYNCQCTPEWTGSEANECQRQPNVCHNGGTCINIQGGHFCVCVNGWTGESCSENIDDCATAVCFNGATCHDRVASFFCECPVGKTGLLCHLEDACVRNPCHVNATCDTNPVTGRVICTCPPGFTGKACDQDVDECSIGVNPCKHFGRCVNTHGSFRCQ